MGFPLVPKSVTLYHLERRNDRRSALRQLSLSVMVDRMMRPPSFSCEPKCTHLRVVCLD